jgi:hypothetical protein
MDNNLAALLILIIVIISIVLVAKNLNYFKYKKETFANYQDVKNKTINWCKKMQEVGLMTPDQYDSCVGTYKDVTAGVLPKEFKIPDTGMPYNYSLYDTKQTELTPNIADANVNTVMFVTYNGLTMACKPDNTLYFIPNINDPKLNQQELYFTLVPQTENVYGIVSPNGKFLISNTDYGATFTGNSIGPMSTWNITKIEGNIMIESIQFNEFRVIFNDDDKNIGMQYGKTEQMIWTLIPKQQNKVNAKFGVFNDAELQVNKVNVLEKLKIGKIQKLGYETSKEALMKLQDTISDHFENIINYVQDKINYTQTEYAATNSDYETRKKSFIVSGMSGEILATALANIPGPNGTNLSTQEIADATEQINIMKNFFLKQIQKDIADVDANLIKLDLLANEEAYNNYIDDLQNQLAIVKSNIDQNNIIMSRQQATYDKLNKDYKFINDNRDKYKKIDEKTNINMQLISGYSDQTKLLLKIYPAGLALLLIFTIYLGYSTFTKFINNIYNKY